MKINLSRSLRLSGGHGANLGFKMYATVRRTEVLPSEAPR